MTIKRLGVLGTLVWDRIWHPSGATQGPREQWGGIAYSLAAMAAACPPGWRIVPLVRVGADLSGPALEFFASLPGVSISGGPIIVPEENNRVELRYATAHERVERLTGGVSGWSWSDLAAAASGLDALYVNFISGYEMELPSAERLRELKVPTYADLHSLFLGGTGGSSRPPRRPPALERWIGSFDAVQMNEREFELATGAVGDSDHVERITMLGPRLGLVTRGTRGAHYARRGKWSRPRDWPLSREMPAQDERVRSGFVPISTPIEGGDPTGCGDLWGAVLFAGLLSGFDVEGAMHRANETAARKLLHPALGDLLADLTTFLSSRRVPSQMA